MTSRQTRVVLICCLGLLGGGFDLAERTTQKLVQRRLPEIESFRPVKIQRPRFALAEPMLRPMREVAASGARYRA